MIRLSNGHGLEYMIASGALAFDGKGWPWEKPLIWSGKIQPDLFTVVVKSLKLYPTKGNLRWWKPWECVRPIPGGAVNKVGLTNPGIEWWCQKVAPRIDFFLTDIIGSIHGDRNELVHMAIMLNQFELKALQINVSCPNTDHAMDEAREVIASVTAVRQVSKHPIIIKVSVAQNYLAIAEGVADTAEAIDLNSVPWDLAFPNGEQSPLRKLGGGGGVSGKPAQHLNWRAVEQLAKLDVLPVIGPSIMEYDDLRRVRNCGAQAVSFGAIHLPTYGKLWTLFTNPCKPTQIVLRDMEERRKKSC